MPVDPASLVALSGLAARGLPDDAALIADPSPATPAAEVLDVDVPAPFWVEPPAAAPLDDAVAVEHLSDVGIGLVAASPEPVDLTDAAPRRLPQRPPSLAGMTTASRAFAARHLPALQESSRQLASSTVAHVSAWRMPDLGTFPTLDADARRRLALLAGSSVAAGLACGLAVPVAAGATPATASAPTGTTTPSPAPSATVEAQLLGSASPFAATDGATADPATAGPATAPAAPAAPAPTAKPASTAKPAAPAPSAPPATAPAPTSPTGTGGTGGTSGSDGTAAVLAALLGPATTPFAATVPSPAAPAATASAPP